MHCETFVVGDGGMVVRFRYLGWAWIFQDERLNEGSICASQAVKVYR